MFSVVIPLYNKELSIKETVYSVLNQTFKHFEIIIVNDGSTDNSLNVVNKIDDPRIKIVDKKNGGVSSARNIGIREASHEWVTFLDGDDLWELNHLEEYSITIQSNNKLNWLLSGYKAVNAKKEFINIYKKEGALHNVFDDLLNGLKIHTSTVCVKRELFANNSELYFKEGINNSEDREVWYKLCALDNNPYYVMKSLSIYKLDDVNSLTKIQTADHFLKLFDRIQVSTIYENMNFDDKQKLILHLNNFNSKAIKGYYLRNTKMKDNYKNYLSSSRWFILNTTINFPNIIKKIISRIC
ncbi:glycosyl transferase [Sphingobacterium faecium NBRC 15299]|uniref:glycosyltransferase family 2 protein n=1 Tax=Sphingobacterium faecium TaxID=34087 RepID=UPI000D3A1669|nr:glycosyltransferase family A protein [Sphingobacterium faecium]PTX12470.1 glycosyl transferase family 2 [Sphingobacterium faecium]GEM62179.1 glycosyl transferase [Sphingobacterium faecium NBRC 15299]